MSAHTCCKAAANGNNVIGPAENIKQPVNIAKRFIKAAGSIIPGIMLVFMPKCPLCVAYYITVVTGSGVSFTTAKYMRIALLLVCISSLAYIIITLLQKMYRRLSRH